MILNLSMNFRDKSRREKFFVTYAESPTQFRRMTVSLDYRTPEPGSLEADLADTQTQKAKLLRIFEAVRECLADIEFYETVTNLKLETNSDGQLYVHVREDASEIEKFCRTGMEFVLADIKRAEAGVDPIPMNIFTASNLSMPKAPQQPREEHQEPNSRPRRVHRATSSALKRTFVYEPEIVGYLNDVKVSAFPDTGSARNIISHEYAERHHLKIDNSASSVMRTAIGSPVRTLGTASLSFRFAEEPTVYIQEFHVFPRSLKSVILGKPFLQMTETLSRFAHRVVKKLRGVISGHHACFTGSPGQWLAGIADGEHLLALPDTGADICLMSLQYAQARGYTIDPHDEHRRKLAFVDGSRAETIGRVEGFEWRFGSRDCETYHPDVYVLEDLRTNLLLSYDFLEESGAYSEFQGCFVNIGEVDEDGTDGWTINAAKLILEASGLRKLGRNIKRKMMSAPEPAPGMFLSRYTGALADIKAETKVLELGSAQMRMETDSYEQRCKAAQLLSEPAKSVALEVARTQWSQFWATRPSIDPGKAHD
jgi:hypothetical protein